MIGATMLELVSGFLILLHSVACVVSETTVSPDTLVVQTANGAARGVTLDTGNGKQVDAWLGLPYAQKPIGDLRFKPPQPVGDWSDTLNATKQPSMCMQSAQGPPGQSSGEPSEDCLYLSVYAPRPRPASAAVMVWIHGGAYRMGGLSDFDPTVLVAERDVVVVGLQYRLSYFGFLYLGGEDALGGAGMLDQAAALQWVHANVDRFGGDPSRITIFGQSAGGGAVLLHLLSPVSRDSFARAIIESGVTSTLVPTTTKLHFETYTHEEARSNGLQLARAAGCEVSASLAEVARCLRNVPAAQLVEATERVAQAWPVVDGTFLVESPPATVATWRFKNTSILAGTLTGDGIFDAGFRYSGVGSFREGFDMNRSEFEGAVRLAYPGINAAAMDAVAFEYTQSVRLEDKELNRDAVGNVYTDLLFSCPVDTVAQQYTAANNDVYMFYFTHHPSTSRYPAWTKALHGNEIPFVMGQVLDLKANYTAEEKRLSEFLMMAWSNFAKFGDPTKSDGSSNITVSWPKYTASSQSYLILDTTESKATQLGKSLFQCYFWNDYIPKLIEDSTCKASSTNSPLGTTRAPKTRRTPGAPEIHTTAGPHDGTTESPDARSSATDVSRNSFIALFTAICMELLVHLK